MPVRVFIDGQLHDEHTAVVSVFDRGFLYGDSVYEVVRTAGGHGVDLARHLDRLARSAAAIGLPEVPRARIEKAIAATLAAAANPESYIRVVLTRGVADIGLDPALAERACLVVIVRPLHLPTPEQYAHGVEVALVSVQRNPRRALDPAVKSGNYLNNILALAEARTRRAYESIMCNAAGHVVEGSSSNLFVVKDGVVRTPAFEDGLLDGITRRRVMELLGSAVEAHVDPDDLRRADESFLTSSLRGVVPVVRVDGAPIGAGVPGPVTRHAMARYAEFLADVGRGAR